MGDSAPFVDYWQNPGVLKAVKGFIDSKFEHNPRVKERIQYLRDQGYEVLADELDNQRES